MKLQRNAARAQEIWMNAIQQTVCVTIRSELRLAFSSARFNFQARGLSFSTLRRVVVNCKIPSHEIEKEYNVRKKWKWKGMQRARKKSGWMLFNKLFASPSIQSCALPFQVHVLTSRQEAFSTLTTKCGGGFIWTHPSKIPLLWAMNVLFFTMREKIETLWTNFFIRKFAVQKELFWKVCFFNPTTHTCTPCSSEYTSPTMPVLLEQALLIHILLFEKVWCPYLL